jgi:hypothetical protein
VSPVKYELGFYIPEDDILHSHRRENLKSFMDSLSSEQAGMALHVNSMMNLVIP